MKIGNSSNNIQFLKKNARSFVTMLNKQGALVPVILLEAAVTGGRSYHAYQRGGFVEGRERLTEESIGAIFWLGGVTAFNKMGDELGKRLLGFKNIDFDVHEDSIRKPLHNFISQNNQHGNALINKLKLTKVTQKTLATFKFTKIISSVLLANAVVGFVVPKLNQRITKNYQKSIEKIEQEKQNSNKKPEDINSFVQKTNEKMDKPAFKGIGSGVQTMFSLTHKMENNAAYKLLSTDIGIAGGRAINARNKHERTENLFRDLSSLYFYLLSMKHISSGLNYLMDKKFSRLDPDNAKLIHDEIGKDFENNKTYSVEEFKKMVFGNEEAKLPEEIKFKNGIIEIEELKKYKKLMSVEQFSLAEKMSELQPKVEGKAILTDYQLLDVFKGGKINDPELIKKVFEKYEKGSTSNPTKFVAEETLITLRKRMHEYANNIAEKAHAKGLDVSLDLLKSVNRTNFFKSAFSLGTGFAISAYCLATVIPKVQYWITKVRTGKNHFPGVENYEK